MLLVCGLEGVLLEMTRSQGAWMGNNEQSALAESVTWKHTCRLSLAFVLDVVFHVHFLHRDFKTLFQKYITSSEVKGITKFDLKQ